MVSADYEIVEAEWPDSIPAAKKAILDFLKTSLTVAEIKGDKEFLVNIRRTAKSNPELDSQVELKMVDGKMFIRRKDADSTTVD